VALHKETCVAGALIYKIIRTMKTEESNKLIAEFMGWEISIGHEGMYDLPDGLSKDYHSLKPGYMKFHTSWDWLMPVVEKIEQEHQGVPQQMLYVNLYSRLEEVYEAAVEFIKWYNEQK